MKTKFNNCVLEETTKEASNSNFNRSQTVWRPRKLEARERNQIYKGERERALCLTCPSEQVTCMILKDRLTAAPTALAAKLFHNLICLFSHPHFTPCHFLFFLSIIYFYLRGDLIGLGRFFSSTPSLPFFFPSLLAPSFHIFFY